MDGTGPVVVGVDGSTGAEHAVRWAAAQADRWGVGLRLVHAIGLSEFIPTVSISPSTDLYGALEEHGEQVLRESVAVASECDADVEVQSEATPEPPIVALMAESTRARCIVLGECGHAAFTGLLLGSKTITLAGHAHCPVVSVRGAQDDESPAPVVVGVDCSEVSDMAVEHAFDEAQRREVGLVAVHAYSDADARSLFAESRMEHGWEPLERSEGRLLAERLADCARRHPDVALEPVVVPAKPREELLERSRTASLLVIGSRGRGGFAGLLLGSTSQALLHHAECPVMVVRPDAAEQVSPAPGEP